MQQNGSASSKPVAPTPRWGLYSRLVGRLARTPVPKPLRGATVRGFARLVGADLGEAAQAPEAYPSLAAFFVRELRAGARPIATAALVSPCDGVVATVGPVTTGTLVQAKGRTYALGRLLADDAWATQLEGGQYTTIYLSPRDYHRVHAPCAGTVTEVSYVPGRLFPVAPRYQHKVDDLYAANERVVFRLASALGDVAVVMVGAAGVGNLEVMVPGASFESRHHRELDAPRRLGCESVLAAGAPLGAFHLGSTVIVVTPAGGPAFNLDEGAPVRLGQAMVVPPTTNNPRHATGGAR